MPFTVNVSEPKTGVFQVAFRIEGELITFHVQSLEEGWRCTCGVPDCDHLQAVEVYRRLLMNVLRNNPAGKTTIDC